MEDCATNIPAEVCDPPHSDPEANQSTISKISKVDESVLANGDDLKSKDESGLVIDHVEDENNPSAIKEPSSEVCENNEDIRSLGDLDSLPAGDDLVLCAAGSDSGVEGCGRALSSGGGSRSCASSVVSCGSGCGSESSSLAGAPPRPRRRVNVTVTDGKRNSPIGSSTPRPVTAPRGPNLATRERARSREKPTLPEKPRPLTPKPKIRPTADLPNLVRESPALRAKPTKTSTARCRTPISPTEEKKWPTTGTRLSNAADPSATRVAADKYGTLPRRKRDQESESSPKHESTPPQFRRPTVARSVSSRPATKTRVRIYAEKTSQTVLLGTDIESALAGVLPDIENRAEVTKCHRGVQASSRDTEISRLTSAAETAQAAAAEERERRVLVETQLAAERAARLAAIAELERNSQRLLELAGAAGAGTGADGCLRALEEQLKSTGELATKQRGEIDALRALCDKLHTEACSSRESARQLEGRLAEAEREAAEMQDFLAAETGALGDSLRETEAELARALADLERSRAECRQMVRMCEQRRQEALSASARARGGARARHALDVLARRLHALTGAVVRAYRLPNAHAHTTTVYHNDAYSRSDSEALTPEEEVKASGLLAAVARALRAAPAPAYTAAPPADDDRSRLSDDNDNSADLLDSETEPCFITDPEYAEEWWSGAEGVEGGDGQGAWSCEELSPEREWCEGIGGEGAETPASASERDSLRNLSAAIAHRQRTEAEAEELERSSLIEHVAAVDERLSELVRAVRLAATHAAAHNDHAALRLAHALRDKIEVTEKNAADVVVKKLAEIEASKNMMDHYRQSVEMLKKLTISNEADDLEILEQEISSWSDNERRSRCEAVESAASSLSRVGSWPRLAPLAACLDRLVVVLTQSDRNNSHHTNPTLPALPLHTTTTA